MYPGPLAWRYLFDKPFRNLLRRARQPDCRLDHFAEPPECGQIPFAKCVHFPGEQLKDAQHFAIIDHGHDGDRGNPELSTSFAVHARIEIHIVAAQKLAGAYALRRKPEFGGKQGAQLRRIRSSAGAAEHVIFSATPKGDRRSARPGNVLGAVGEQLQRRIQIALCHMAERMTFFRRHANSGLCARDSKRGGNTGLRGSSCGTLLQHLLRE